MKSLTIIYITARKEPKLEWFMDSLRSQSVGNLSVIVVDLFAGERNLSGYDGPWYPIKPGENPNAFLTIVQPKPSVWQGPHRLTKEDWWDISGARNTGICLCQNEWIAFCDDRCVLSPTWLSAVREAISGNYAVSGSYEKCSGMVVENGAIINPGVLIGIDPRNPKGRQRKAEQTFGDSWYGCTSALPLEWCLEMNGWHEDCSGLGLEDVVFGNMLVLNNHITKFDARMKIIEDRSPEACQNMPLRTDKDRHLEPRDKSHILLERCNGQKYCNHPFNIRDVRSKVLAGEPWPIPTEPKVDWYDQEPLSEMFVR